ncbi:MAG TPA: hypothetical protein VL068_10305 [Microthrixaceae bacterium]|nr:hypothetical protein [Microthrixaceae bacterium]
MTAASFQMKYQLSGSGWATAHLADDVAEVTITASYLSDALRDLVDAVTLIGEGVTEVTCTWQEEPGEYYWVLNREADGVRLRILFFGSGGQGRTDDAGRVVFETLQPLEGLLRAVLGAVDGVLAHMTEAEYLDQWVQHSFPTESVERLRRALGETKTGVRLLSWFDAVRARPEMYLGPNPTPLDLLLEVITDAMYELSCQPSAEALLEIRNTSARVIDSGEGLRDTPIRGHDRLVTLFATLDIPHLDERGYLPAVSALCRRLKVATTTGSTRRWITIERGIIVDGPHREPASGQRPGTDITIEPDSVIFGAWSWPTPFPDFSVLLRDRVGSRGWWTEELLERMIVIDERVAG